MTTTALRMPAPTRFFTPRRPMAADVSGSDAIELLAWHSEVHAPVPADFQARMSIVVFDSLALVRIRHSPAEVRRTAEHVISLAAGSTVYFVLSGTLTARQSGKSLSAGAGSALILSGHHPFELSCTDPVDLVIVVLRRRALDSRGVPDSESDVRTLPASSYLSTVAAFLAALASDPPRPASTEGVTAQQAMLHLLTGVLSSATDAEASAARRSRSDGRHEHAIGFIAAHYSDPDLTTADVAVATGLSPRHLQRLLAEAGTSVATELRRSRMHWAIALLGQPDRAGTSLEQIAMLTGFGSAARMRRAFLAEQGMTPARYRAAPPGEKVASLAR